MKREWRYDTTTRTYEGVKLYVSRRPEGDWYWDIARDGAVRADGVVRTEHLAKIYAMRAAKRLLKESK